MNSGIQLVLTLVIGIFIHEASSNLKVLYKWTQLEFDYRNEADRQKDIDSGNFDVGKIVALDADVYYPHNSLEPTVFVTVPRFQQGIPATLGTVNKHRSIKGNPVITPFPSWSWHQNPESCKKDRLVSVYRTAVDKKCNRLWVMDTGSITNQTCPPQILAFDLSTNRVVHRYEIPSSQYTSVSLFITPVVDVRESCEDAFVYVADVTGFALLVHNVAAKTSWKIVDKTFYPYPNWGTFLINGTQFDLMDGIFALALSPYIRGRRDRLLFYHALASNTEQAVLTSNIRNQTLFQDDAAAHPELFHKFELQRNSQSSAEAMDRHGILYFGLVKDDAVACWNSNSDYLSPYSSDLIEVNHDTLQFPSGMKVIQDNKGNEQLWTFTSRYQKSATGTLNPSEVNFRILVGNIPEILAGKKC